MLHYMTDDQIEALRVAAKAGNVHWRSADGAMHRVLGVKLDWVEFPDQPTLTEPAAYLERTVPVALYNEHPSAFFLAEPLFDGA